MTSSTTFGPHLDRLVSARAGVMRRRPRLGEILCSYGFAASASTTALARDGDTVLYNRDYVAAATEADLITELEAIALRDAARLGA